MARFRTLWKTLNHIGGLRGREAMDAGSATIELEREWQVPVMIRIGYGASEIIRGPSDAFDYLTHRWPIERGSHFENAKGKCKAALNWQISSEMAREEFIAAAIESYVLA
jgi:hypothetical protein